MLQVKRLLIININFYVYFVIYNYLRDIIKHICIIITLVNL